MGTKEISDFKKLYKKWIETADYINEKWEEFKAEPGKIDRVMRNFKIKYSDKMDEAWLSLSDIEQKRFSSIYQSSRKKVSARMADNE